MKPVVYAGGPVDYRTGEPVQHTSAWPSDFPASVFCPSCEVRIGDSDEAIMERNQRALANADIAVFVLDGTFTVGTPVEVEWKLGQLGQDPGRVAIVHPAEPGLFVRRWQHMGATVLRSMEEVGPWLRALLT